MPVIAAVNGFCVGGGIGLAGNADIVIASDDAYFGLPEVDRGALGAATHLARLVPQHKMRAMVYTGATATAAELHAFGSVLRRRAARRAARRRARGGRRDRREVADGDPARPRSSLNGIDLWDVKRSYRFEQGFTFELNLSGVSDELRDAFVDKRDADIVARRSSVTDKRMTEDDVVAELRDGMTIGIGGWGSRRKPMAIVRAIARSGLKDLTVVSYGGPDVGLLCATGKVTKVIYPFCSLDTIALEPHFRNAARSRVRCRRSSSTRACSCCGLQAAALAGAVPADPGRARFGRGRPSAEIKTVRLALRRRRGVVAAPALDLDVAHHPHAPR